MPAIFPCDDTGDRSFVHALPLALVDKIAERVQTFGRIAVGDPRHVAEITKVIF